jgi:AcrR family transcriptional regulator
VTRRRPGRPAGATAGDTREAILDAALALLDGAGVAALTMRAIARGAGTNPMTVYHHFGGREGVIWALAERSYAPVRAPEMGSARDRIGALLRAYHGAVVRHPQLALAIFAMPAVFPDQARRITGDLIALLEAEDLAEHHVRLWLPILVDFTHGAALATAMGAHDGGGRAADAAPPDDFSACLDALLARLPGGTA